MATAEMRPTPTMPQATDNSTLIGTASASPPARWYLRCQAIMWRFLMAIGMFLHRLAPPRPSNYAFVRQIPTTISPNSGSVNLYFYTPKNYNVQRRLGKPGSRFPVVVNFHGGGFTIGHPTDDARWATAVMEECGAVVVCVEYRLAPEHPFPTAVEDGVDALLYVAANADELHLDADRIAVSGFSCGGNLAFTVPLRLHEELDPRAGRDTLSSANSLVDAAGARLTETDATGAPNSLPSRRDSSITSPVHPTKAAPATATTRELASPDAADVAPAIAHVVKPVAVVAWYPSADYTLTRMQRRQANLPPGTELSPVFTSLFDSSYLSPPDLNKANPFLSPGRAPEALLRDGLPNHIVMLTCEWDMLRGEGTQLRDRLAALGKRVAHTDVARVPHGWDKSPNPFAEAPGVREHYKSACRELRRAFAGKDADEGERRRSFGIGRFSFTGRRETAAKRESVATL